MRQAAAALAIAFLLALAPPALGEPYEDTPELGSTDADYAAGRTAISKRDWREAVKRFNQAAVRHPENADLHNFLGFAYRNLGQMDLSFKHYKRALELNPRHRGAHEYIGEAYLQVNDLASAEKHLDALRGICLLPCEELADLEKAVTHHKTKKP